MELAEQAFATELQRLTAHLAERLTGLHDGQPKVFRDSAVENLREFFERLGRLNIRSSPELDAHVEQAELTINGIEAWRGGRCRMTSEMELVVAADGVARCIYGEELDLREIGRLSITRASHVEPDAEGYWWADMGLMAAGRRRCGRRGSGWLDDASPPRPLTLPAQPAPHRQAQARPRLQA